MLTESDYAAIEAERYATLEDAEMHADDMNNNDLDSNAEAIVVKHGGYLGDDCYGIRIIHDWKSATR